MCALDLLASWTVRLGTRIRTGGLARVKAASCSEEPSLIPGAVLARATQWRSAIALTGGGARAAYQVGLLRCLAEMAPDYRFRIITGVSAGAVNAAFLASRQGGLAEATKDHRRLWRSLQPDRVFRTGGLAMARNVVRWGVRLVSGGVRVVPEVHGLMDTVPLAQLLERELSAVDGEFSGIARNLEAGRLDAVSLTTLNYGTGQTTTWVQGCDIPTWERPDRCSAKVRLTVDHVMASAALPLFFPAVRLAYAWHGDGGIRMAAPLAPAVHLGANRIITVSTQYKRSPPEAELREATYPPPTQILGNLLNAVFLDAIDQDAEHLNRINSLLQELPAEKHKDLREIETLVIRPSVDLGELAREHEADLPRWFRFLTRGLGTRETRSADLLSLLMFQSDYIGRVIEIGEADAREHCDELSRLVLG